MTLQVCGAIGRWGSTPTLEHSSPVQCPKRGLHVCVGARELGGCPRASPKWAAPVGGTGIEPSSWAWGEEPEEPGPRNGPAQWLTEPCVYTCRSRPGGSRLLGGLSPPPRYKRKKMVTQWPTKVCPRLSVLPQPAPGVSSVLKPCHLISLTRGIGCITTIFFLARVMMWGVRMNWPKHCKRMGALSAPQGHGGYGATSLGSSRVPSTPT